MSKVLQKLSICPLPRLRIERWMAFRSAVMLLAWWAGQAAAGDAAKQSDELDGYVAVPQIWDGVAESFLIAPAGGWFAATWAGSSDIKIVDMTSGTILRRLSANGGKIRAGAITKDSKSIVAQLYDGRFLSWNAETGRAEPKPPKGLPLQSFETGAPSIAKSPYSVGWSRGKNGHWTIDVSGGSPTMKAVRVELDDVQSAVDTPCGVDRGTAISDGTHLVVSRGSGEDALEFALPATVFELKDGVARKLWEAPCGSSGGNVAADPRYFSIPGDAPIGPLTIWDIQSNQVVAHFADSDGVFAMTEDARIIVTPGFDKETKQFEMYQEGRNTTLPRQIANIAALELSPDGHWLAARVRPDRTDLPDLVAVISMADGRQTKTVTSPIRSEEITASKVSNDGDVRLTFRTKQEDEEIGGRSVLTRSGDGHWAELADSTDDSKSLIFDLRRQQFVARIPNHVANFTRDGRFLATTGNSLFDLVAMRLVWNIQGTPDDHGYVMLYSNGCVQISPGSERFLKLVHGFDIRPYDAAAARAFTKPGCMGRPEAVAASETMFAADKATLAALARENEVRRDRKGDRR